MKDLKRDLELAMKTFEGQELNEFTAQMAKLAIQRVIKSYAMQDLLEVFVEKNNNDQININVYSRSDLLN